MSTAASPESLAQAPTQPPLTGEREQLLRREHDVFLRYLVGRASVRCAPERYHAACDALFPGPASLTDAWILRLAVQRPRLLPFLDAACGLLEPKAQLRKRLLALLAILETIPENVAIFQPREQRPLRLVATLAGRGLCGVARVALGVPLLLLAPGRRK